MARTKPADVKTSDAERISALVDEIGDLETELAPHKTKEARLKKLREQLRAEYDTKPAKVKYTAEGKRYAIEIGARGWQTIVNLSKLYKSVKLNVFLQIVGATLKAIEQHAGAAVLASVTHEDQTGHRSLTITAKGVQK